MGDYYQIASDGEAEINIKGSRFICSLKRISTQEEAIQFINEKKKEHKKATHNCSAYLIGESDNIQRAHDDGEPSGTAGVPMLEVLKKQELHNIVAVVTRYFGGVKLGAGGLIRAYGSAVSYAIKQIGIINHCQEMIFEISSPYHLTGKFEYFLSNSHYRHLDTTYTDVVTYHIGVLFKNKTKFLNDIQENFQNQLQSIHKSTQYIDLPIEQNELIINEDDFE